jgi:hypothetical protein
LRFASSKTLWLLASAGALAALAWSAQQDGAARVATAPAPQIRAADEAPRGPLRVQLELELGLLHPGARVSSGTDYACSPSPCTAADVADAVAQLAARLDAIRPARGTPPRVVARLPGVALLLAWHNTANLLCLQASRLPAGGGGGVFGPCAPEAQSRPCAALCLRSGGSGATSASVHYLLAGTVSRDATALRITRSTGPPVLYPLRGPVLPGTDRRVFMVPLGRRDWRVLELLEGGAVTAVEEMPARQAAFEDCQEHSVSEDTLRECAKASVPFP